MNQQQKSALWKSKPRGLKVDLDKDGTTLKFLMVKDKSRKYSINPSVMGMIE